MKSIYKNQTGSLLIVVIVIFAIVLVVLAGLYTKYRIDAKNDAQKSNQQTVNKQEPNQTPVAVEQKPATSTTKQNNNNEVVQGAGFKISVPSQLYYRNCLTESTTKDNLVSVAKNKDDLWCHGTGQGEYYTFSCDPSFSSTEVNSTMPTRVVNGVTFYQTYNNTSDAGTFITYTSQKNAAGNNCTVGYTSQKGLDLDTFNKVFDTLVIE